MLTFPVGFLGGRKNGPLTIESVGGYSTTPTFSADFGPGGSDLFCAVACVNRGSPNMDPTSVSVGGYALSKTVATSNDYGECSIWFGKGPNAGGIQPIIVTGGTAQFPAFKAFAIKGSNGTSVDHSASALGDLVTLGVTKGGVLLAATSGYGAPSWSGAVLSDWYPGNIWGSGWATDVEAASNGSHTVSVGSTVNAVLVVASFKP